MKLSRLFLPLLTLLIIGTGCALSSADTKRGITAVVEEGEKRDDAVSDSQPKNAVIESADQAVYPVAGIPLAPLVRNVLLKDGDFYFEPLSILARTNEIFTLTFADDHTGHHTFNIDELDIHEEIQPGKMITITAPALPGRYAYYCDVGPHRTLGMEGELIVE